MTRLIAVSSARGSVGTSTIAVNLAMRLAQGGRRVCLLDAVRSGPGRGLRDLALDGGALEAVLTHDRRGFDILAGQGKAPWPGELEPAQRQRLASCMSELDGYDLVLVDSVAGVDAALLCLVLASPEVILTVTPQAAHLREGYALLKLLTERQYRGEVSLLVNRSGDAAAAQRACDRFREAAQRHLDRRVPLLGVVREDPAVRRGQGVPLAGPASDSPVQQDLTTLVAQLLNQVPAGCERNMQDFGDAWLQAACDASQSQAVLIAADTRRVQQSRRELQEQVAALATHIDALVAEIDRLRAEGEDIARLVTAPDAPHKPLPAADIEAWLAGLASGLEQLRRGEYAFPVYQLRRAGGDLLRVAFHACDAEPAQTDPRSTSS